MVGMNLKKCVALGCGVWLSQALLSAQQLSKEYIRFNGRVIIVENPGGSQEEVCPGGEDEGAYRGSLDRKPEIGGS
jgi:hypothetical protein